MGNQREAVIVEAVRTPIGRKKGKLKNHHPVDLGATVVKEIIRRTGIDPLEIEDAYFGCVSQVGEQGLNIGRNIILAAGFPVEVPAISVDRQCGSSLTTVNLAAMAVMSGVHDCVLAGGVESMNRIPMGTNISAGGNPFPPSITDKYSLVPQGLSAEMICEKWNLSREEIDEFSYQSHMKAAKAIQEGRFKSQIVPLEVTLDDGTKEIMDTDEGVRPNTSMEKLASLPPAFKPDGKITAGNSSQISDGAGAVLIMSREKADKLGLKPRARFVAMDVVGDDPVIMLTGPIPATKKILAKTEMRITDLDVIEINEAFAPVPIAWGKEVKPDWSRVNPNGGAIAHGHPLGATGSILITKTLYELERTGGRYGMVTLCTGGGMAPITIIERIEN